MLLKMTQAGNDQITDARLAGTVLPAFDCVVVDTVDQLNISEPNVQVGYEAKITLSEIRREENTLYFEVNVPPDIAVHVRGLGLKTNDGAIIAYERYYQGGFNKRIGTNLILECQYDITDRQDNEITFVYQPLDVDALIKRLSDSIYADIEEKFNTRIAELESALDESTEVCSIGGTNFTEDSKCVQL